MSKITDKMLNILVDQLNEETGNPKTYMDENRKIQIGHYHINYAYGGCELVQTMSEGGGIKVISESGYTTKSNLFNQIKMYLKGKKKC